MIDYSYQNHLTFSYGGREMSDKAKGESVVYHFSPCSRQPGTFREECVRTAQLIYQQAQNMNREVYLLVSGGLDSVAMVKGFIEAGVPFKTATYAFENGLNEHELEHVRDIVAAHNLDHTYLWMDALKWFKGDEAHEWFHRTNATSLATLPLMKLMQHVWFDLDGLPVFGGGDMDVIKENGKWFYGRFESFISRYWFSERFGLGAFISFFQHTPEIILSILREPEIQRAGLGNDRLANAVLNELKIIKYNVIHRTWQDLRRRPKFGGTELFHAHILPIEERWKRERSLDFDEIWKYPFSDFCSSISPLPSAAAAESAPR